MSIRRLAWLIALVLVVTLAGVAGRFRLPGYAVRSVLRLAGASRIEFRAATGTPWHLEIEALQFHLRTQPVSARRVVLDRARWWTASLGDVRVEDLDLPVALDGSDVNPWQWTTYENGPTLDEAVNLPLRTLELGGTLRVSVTGAPDMPLAVTLHGRPLADGLSWEGELSAEGEGFAFAGSGSLLRAGQELEFKVQRADLDVAVWSAHLQRLVSLPGAPWQIQGRLHGTGEGRVTSRRFAATAQVTLTDGAMRVETRDVAATGIDADLEFSDLWKWRTKSGTARVRDFHAGRFTLRDLEADIGLWGANTVVVNRARGRSFDGTIAATPFRYYLDQKEVGLTVQAEAISARALLALAPSLAVELDGRVGGEVALRVDPFGVRLEKGWLALDPSAPRRLRISPPGLIRAGARVDDASLRVLKGLPDALQSVEPDELRLDIRPEDAPLGSSARLRLAGNFEGAPAAASLDVQGAIENYLEVMP